MITIWPHIPVLYIPNVPQNDCGNYLALYVYMFMLYIYIYTYIHITCVVASSKAPSCQRTPLIASAAAGTQGAGMPPDHQSAKNNRLHSKSKGRLAVILNSTV